jgi:hypothetical protein
MTSDKLPHAEPIETGMIAALLLQQTESSELLISSGTSKTEQHRIIDNTLCNTKKLIMYNVTS